MAANAAEQRDQREPQEADQPRPFLGRTRKAVGYIAAVDAWKRSARIVAYRASFPLLRQVVRGAKKDTQYRVVAGDAVPTEVLIKSLKAHTLVLMVLTPALIWTAFTLTRGMAALVIHSVWTTWLLYSVPLLVYIAAKIIVSAKSRKAIVNELASRSVGGGLK